MNYRYIRVDGVRKSIGFDEQRGKLVTEHPNIGSYTAVEDQLNFHDEASVMRFIGSTRILGLPTFEHSRQFLMASRKQKSENLRFAKAITRTKDNFSFPDAPGLMFVDCDMKEKESKFQPLERLGVPLDCLRVEYPSSSSWISRGNQWLSQESGRHIILAVESAAAIPLLGHHLYLRSWLYGGGYVHVTPNARALDRSFIDQAVWQPERFIFGDPVLAPGLARAQTLPAVSGSRPLRLSDLWLSPEQEQQALAMIADARRKAVASPATAEKRRAYAMATLSPGETLEQAVQRVDSMAKLGMLPPWHRIATKYGVVTVREIFDNFERYYGMEIADPVEPFYGGADPRIAMFVYLLGFAPGIYSHAHGGQEWVLMPALVNEQIGAVSDPDDYCDLEDLHGD